ncbi:uncharacterized protein F5Z01DRAFT_369018 [Emericellopsis atlantica]|uniref:Uncharacterized protein n=1 Tax=Emericellopsis atlantica TaxID=2614577 RepID=A0A9P7ZEF7_9HYPO|nr:uncharacterized protein F5Z01DRAFT_369018 [Emericellopsis atlantica]KAG9250495.1 hypothetical protein F5Z01DRAFT_369018 [Emericellopsis atlantica]
MATPLSPAMNGALNAPSPLATQRNEQYDVQAYTAPPALSPETDDDSSPFISRIENDRENPSPSKPRTDLLQENISPKKSQHSRVRSGAEMSPLKILADRKSPSPLHGDMPPPPTARSPRKMSPEKRFPVKVSNPIPEEREVDLEDMLRDNQGLTQAIEIFEDEDSSIAPEGGEPQNTTPPAAEDSAAGMDESMISTFSTFSAVPSMDMFAKLGTSPGKPSPAAGPSTPRGKPESATSRPFRKRESDNTTNLLIDFTEQLRNPHRSAAKVNNMMNNNTLSTPGRRMSNLLDFDIPPMPTPRSVPTISARELESLKSNFLSEISSLKASLSGKEAEVNSLKTAVGDAEKRVGESLEQLREEKSAKEQLAAELEDWETRSREMETVLQRVRGDIETSQNEREELERKLDESEKRREAAEMLHQEAESKMAGMRAGRESATTSSPEKPNPSNAQEVELAVERVARELHGLYKSKHETKVAALKKSYETRWQKKIKDLELQMEDLTEENEKLKAGRDATLTKIDPDSTMAGELKAQAIKDNASMTELKAEIQRLEAVVSTVQRDNTDLRGMLEKERVEKGELVQLAEEMMSMQSFVGGSNQPVRDEPEQQTPAPQRSPRKTNSREREQAPHPEAPAAKTPKTSHDGFKANNRASGLRAPGSALRAPGGLPRPGSASSRSGIMNSIETMGSYRGRGGE